MPDYNLLIEELNLPMEQLRVIESTFLKSNEFTAETLEALRNGDHGAYTEIFDAYHDPVRNFLTKMLFDSNQAQELTQQVFLSLWENHHKIDPHKNIKAFIYIKAKFLMFNFLRHKKVITKYEQYEINNPSFDYSPDEIYIGKEMSILTGIAIDDMPPQQQKVFRLRYEECKTEEEIAILLGISKNTVRVHIRNGKKEIEQILISFLLLFMLQ